MSKAFMRDVKIRSIKGNLLTHATLTGVQIADTATISSTNIIEIPQLTAYYNISRLFEKKGDFLAITHLVRIHQAKLHMIRTSDDLWNILMLFPPSDQPLTFHGVIQFDDASLNFFDKRGWGKLPSEFSESFDHINGTLNFYNHRKVDLSLHGKLYHSRFTVNGALDMQKMIQYQLNLKIPQLDLDRWGGYLLAVDGVRLYQNNMSVNAVLTSKKSFHPREVPFYYHIKANLDHAALQLPSFRVPIINICGQLTLKEGQLAFSHVTGELAGITAQSKGQIDLHHFDVDINVKTNSFESARIKPLFPILKAWKFSGKTQSDLRITGTLILPKVSGVAHFDKIALYALDILRGNLAYTYQNQKLDFQLKSASLYDGLLRGKGVVDLAQQPSYIVADFDLKNLSLKSAFPKIAERVSGNMDLVMNVTGPSDRMDLKMIGTEGVFFEQIINKIDLTAHINNNRDIDVKADFYLNADAPITAKGRILNLTDLTLQFFGKEIPIRDISKQFSSDGLGLMRISGELSSQLNTLFWKDPIGNTHITANINAKSYYCYGQKFDTLAIKFNMHEGNLTLDSLHGQQGTAHLYCHGLFDRLCPADIEVKVEQFDISRSRFIQELLPASLKPISGICDLTALIRRNTPSQEFTKENNHITANIQLKNFQVLNQPIQLVNLAVAWDGRHLRFEDATLQQTNTKLRWKGLVDIDQNISLTLEKDSKIDLSEFSVLTAAFGDMTGIGTCEGRIGGKLSMPVIAARIDLVNPGYRFIRLDHIKGGVVWGNRQLMVNKLDISKDNDHYQLNGSVDLTPFYTSAPFSFDELNGYLDVEVNNVNIDSLSEIIENIVQEIKTRVHSKSVPITELIQNANIEARTSQFSNNDIKVLGRNDDTWILYSGSHSNNSLDFFAKAVQIQAENIKPKAIGIKSIWKGAMTGTLHLKKEKHLLPDLQTDIELIDTEISFLRAKKILFKTRSSTENIQISLLIQNGNLGGKGFDSLVSQGSIDSNLNLSIQQTNIVTGEYQNQDVLTGRLPLASLWDNSVPDQLSLKVVLRDNDLGVLSILNKNIDNIQNEGVVKMNITGTFRDPLINSETVNLKNARIFFSSETFLKSPFIIKKYDDLVIKDNLIELMPLHIEWQGEDTKDYHTQQPRLNQLDCSGKIRINQLSFLSPDQIELDMNIALQDTDICVNLQDIYNGDISIRQCTLIGSYIIPFSKKAQEEFHTRIGTLEEKGPVISGEILISNGAIAFPKLGKKKEKPSFLFEINAKIGKDLFVYGSMLGQDFLSGLANNFSLLLEESNDGVYLHGSLNAPVIDRTLVLQSGEVSLFNKAFTLLSVNDQSQFYRNSPEQVKKNTLYFSSQESKKKQTLVPYLNIKAYTDLESTVNVSETPTSSTIISATPLSKQVVVRFQGSVYDVASIYFDEFSQDNKDKVLLNTYELGSKTDNLQKTVELVKLLMPDIIRNAGSYYDEISKNQGFEGDKTRKLISDMSARQINLMAKGFLRPIERNIAQQIGIVDDIQVEYNVGNQLLSMSSNLIGLKKSYGKDEPVVGLSMVKNLTHQLVLKSRTDMDTRLQGPTKVTQIELSYYILENLSFNISNVREYQDEDFQQKFSIKGTLEF